MADATAPHLRRPVPPEVAHTPQRQGNPANFLFRIAGCRGALDRQVVRREHRRATARDGRLGAGPVRDERRRGLVGAGGPAAPGHRRPAGLHLRGQRPPAEERGRSRSARAFREALGIRLHYVDATARVPRRAARRRSSPERKRRIIGPDFIRVFERAGPAARRAAVPRAGHALPGRDREPLALAAARRPRSRPTTTSAACRRT